MECRTVTVGPDLAKKYLLKNKDNRPVRQAHVRDLMVPMKSGEWKLTHQGIAFDEDGNLIDGQHRLMAIVESGVTVRLTVFSNAKRDSFKYLDQGARRSSADILGASQRSAEISRKIASLHQTGKGKIVSQKLLANCHEHISPITGKLLERCGGCTKYFSSVGMKLAAVTRILQGEDEEYVLSTYSNLVNGNTEQLPPIGSALVKQYIAGGLKAQDFEDTLARGMSVFNKNKSSLTRLQVSDAQATVSDVRDFYRNRVAA